jgi:hypothetical protein
MQIRPKYVILALASTVIFIIAVWAMLEHRMSIHHINDPISNAIIDLQNPVPVKQIHVLAGDEFDLILHDDRRIHAVLEVRTSPIAEKRVLEFLNKCRNPRVVIKKDLGEHTWLVEMYLTTSSLDGSEVEVSLAKWLTDKNLAYQ